MGNANCNMGVYHTKSSLSLFYTPTSEEYTKVSHHGAIY